MMILNFSSETISAQTSFENICVYCNKTGNQVPFTIFFISEMKKVIIYSQYHIFFKAKMIIVCLLLYLFRFQSPSYLDFTLRWSFTGSNGYFNLKSLNSFFELSYN